MLLLLLRFVTSTCNKYEEVHLDPSLPQSSITICKTDNPSLQRGMRHERQRDGSFDPTFLPLPCYFCPQIPHNSLTPHFLLNTQSPRKQPELASTTCIGFNIETYCPLCQYFYCDHHHAKHRHNSLLWESVLPPVHF